MLSLAGIQCEERGIMRDDPAEVGKYQNENLLGCDGI